MNINTLMWSDIVITHIKSKKVDKIDTATMACNSLDNCLWIQGYTGVQGTSTNEHVGLVKPKLLFLDSRRIELEAYWWSTHFGPKGGQRHYKHKVKISAKF